MLTVRKEQIDTFAGQAVREFENELVAHIREFAPQLARIGGEPAVRRVVQTGMERAEGYSFTNRGPVRFYVEMMCSLGHDFDSDPQLPWASATLKDPARVAQTVRAERLFSRAGEYFDRVLGPGDSFAVRALGEFSRANFSEFRGPAPGFEARAIRLMERVYPEKCRHAGEPGLRAMLASSTAAADALGLVPDLGRAVIAAAMFTFGHGVLRDPLYPWVLATLRDPSVPSPADRVEALYRKMRVYCDRMAVNLNEGGARA
jgi:hypothetical protein